MKVLLFFESQNLISKSGIGRALNHQIKALESQNIEYTFDPNDTYDVAHINTIGPKSKLLIKKCKKKNIKIIYHAHSTEEDFKNSFIFSNQFAPFFKKRLISLYSQADCIITPTPYSKKLISHYEGITQPIYSISNGIDIQEYDYNKERVHKFREHFHLNENDKVIIGVGLFFKRKGIIDFVEIAKNLPQYTFIWFGSTPLYSIPKDIRQIITKNHPKNVIFPGYITGDIIKGAYAGADAFFFPSYEETEGIVVLEALSSYQQVIVRDIPVYDGWLYDQYNCYKGHTNQEFKDIIVNVVEKKVSDLRENARKTALQKSIPEIGKELKDIYTKVLEDY